MQLLLYNDKDVPYGININILDLTLHASMKLVNLIGFMYISAIRQATAKSSCEFSFCS